MERGVVRGHNPVEVRVVRQPTVEAPLRLMLLNRPRRHSMVYRVTVRHGATPDTLVTVADVDFTRQLSAADQAALKTHWYGGVLCSVCGACTACD